MGKITVMAAVGCKVYLTKNGYIYQIPTGQSPLEFGLDPSEVIESGYCISRPVQETMGK